MFFWKGKSIHVPVPGSPPGIQMNDFFSTFRMRWPGMRSRSQASISGCLKWKKWPE